LLETSTVPVPSGAKTTLPSELVAPIVLPLISILSTVSCVRPARVVEVAPKAILVVPTVSELLASCEFETPPVLIVTSPVVTSNDAVLNVATPRFDDVATSAATVIAVPE